MMALRSFTLAGGFLLGIVAIAALSIAVRTPAIALPAVSFELPVDAAVYPALGAGAPSAAAVNANCLACHSASMVMTQPKLSSDEWAAEVAKMRKVYKAPIAEADDAAIVAWLTAMSALLPPKAKASDG
jgi:cytochrome c5